MPLFFRGNDLTIFHIPRKFRVASPPLLGNSREFFLVSYFDEEINMKKFIKYWFFGLEEHEQIDWKAIFVGIGFMLILSFKGVA